jgi:hypothetical protein
MQRPVLQDDGIHQNPGHWMDVYHTITRAGDPVYLKLMIQNGVLIVSFKEL